jgi:uncharacterized protein (DUF1697 family)
LPKYQPRQRFLFRIRRKSNLNRKTSTLKTPFIHESSDNKKISSVGLGQNSLKAGLGMLNYRESEVSHGSFNPNPFFKTIPMPQPFHIALLRGINVGGKNKLPMKTLVTFFESEGCEAVATYIQSGNVVFRAKPALAQTLSQRIPACIKKNLGFDIPVLIRSATEIIKLPKLNPFLKAGADLDTLHVMFLSDAPSAAALAGLDLKRSPGDSFKPLGRELYLHCPNGFARTKLTNAYFDSKLKMISSVRNWKTVLHLIEMTSL